MAAVALVLGALTYQGIRHSSRLYHKRQSKKHNYASLPTDAFGRPIDPETGEKLTKNKARALAQHHRDVDERRAALQRDRSALTRNQQGHEKGAGEAEALPGYVKDANRDKQHQEGIRKQQTQEHSIGVPAYEQESNSLSHTSANTSGSSSSTSSSSAAAQAADLSRASAERRKKSLSLSFGKKARA